MSVVANHAMLSQEEIVKDLLRRLPAQERRHGNEGTPNPKLALDALRGGIDSLREAVKSARENEELLAAVRKAKSLVLNQSSIGDAGITQLSDAFIDANASKLLRLDLSDNGITERGFKAFVEALEEGSLEHLEYLDISRNPIGEQGMKMLAQVFNKGLLSSLLQLDVSYCKIGDRGAAFLADSMQSAGFSNRILKVLNMSANDFGAPGVTVLSRALIMGRLPNLKHLDLSYNNLGADGTSAIKDVVKAGELAELTDLILTRCELSDNVVSISHEIAKGKLSNLKYLDLSSNCLGDQGTVALAAAIRSGGLSRLQYLILAHCNMSADRLALFMEAIDTGYVWDLRHLDLSSNSLDFLNGTSSIAQGSLALAKLIRTGHLKGLKFLDLSHCSLAESGVMALVKEMEDGNLVSLQHLLMRNNDIRSERSLKVLVRALESSQVPHLEELELGYNRLGDDVNMALATLVESSAAEGPLVKSLREYLRTNKSPVDSPQTLSRLSRVWKSFKSLRTHSLKGLRTLSLASSQAKELASLQTLRRFNSGSSFEGFQAAINSLQSSPATPKFQFPFTPLGMSPVTPRSVNSNNSPGAIGNSFEPGFQQPTAESNFEGHQVNNFPGFQAPDVSTVEGFRSIDEGQDFRSCVEKSFQSVDNMSDAFSVLPINTPDTSINETFKHAQPVVVDTFQGFQIAPAPANFGRSPIVSFKAHSFRAQDTISNPMPSAPILELATPQSVHQESSAKSLSRSRVLERESSRAVAADYDEPSRVQTEEDMERSDKFFFNVILICVWIFAVFVSRL